MKYILFMLLMIKTSYSWAWVCNEPEDTIKRTGDIEASFDCTESMCNVQLSAPHSIEDRTFSGFNLIIKNDEDILLVADLDQSQMGSRFNSQIILNEKSFEGVTVSASYVNYIYGCAVHTVLDLKQEYNTTLKGVAQKSRAP